MDMVQGKVPAIVTGKGAVTIACLGLCPLFSTTSIVSHFAHCVGISVILTFFYQQNSPILLKKKCCIDLCVQCL